MKFILLLVLLAAMPLLPILLNRLASYFRHHFLPPVEHRIKVDEALKILELRPDATEEEIRSAHKRLIQKNHPDSGGSQYIASQINEARDILLKNLKNRKS